MSHAKIGRFSKKQIFELPDGTHRLEPHLYVRVRGNGRYRNYFFRYLDPKGRVCDLAPVKSRYRKLNNLPFC